ncbi:MAG: iron-binding protein [Dehalococcoidia bacterium]|nr:MAG: iron-binding protein [Dehalococcoidia bacterium]
MADGKKPGIKVTKNGPYIVSGAVPLSKQIIVSDAKGDPLEWRTSQQYPAQEIYALCRCGRSKNKPFCDGTHTRVNFDGTETANNTPYLKKAGRIEGPELSLTDCEELCVGAGFCDRDAGTWSLVENSQNPEAKKIAIEEGQDCPSGRLVVWNKQGQPQEPEYEPSIGLMEDPETGVVGPILVRGGIPIESAGGMVYEKRNRVTLCRCGRSKNKPFCDGSHAD